MKKFVKSFVFIATLILLSATSVKGLNFVIDPGHGARSSSGGSTGCVCTYNGKQIIERDLNLKISQYLKEELQKYKTQKNEKVNVYLTRESSNSGSSLCERVQMGVNKNAAAVISIHNNAHANPSNQQGGCMVLVTDSKASNLYEKEEKLAQSILKQLNQIGIPNSPYLKQGLLRKLSTDGSVYRNGNKTDWYGIVRYGIEKNIPAIIIEHAYVNVPNDYQKFLSSDEKLKKIAIADAKGIANYYKLKK